MSTQLPTSEGSNGAAGGNSNSPSEQTAAPATQSASVVSPEIQEMINAAVKKAQDSAFANARRVFEGKEAKGRPKADEQSTQTADDPLALIALRDSFDDAIADMNLTKGQRQILREEIMSKRPSDVAGHVAQFVERAGWNGTEQKQMPIAEPPKQPAAARPLSDQGSIAAPPAERHADVTKWSEGDIERFYQSKNGIVRRGVNGELDVNDPRNSKIHRELRDMAKQRLANVRVQLGPRR